MSDADPDADPKDIAEKLHGHLHRREYRIDRRLPSKSKGRIAARSESIGQNVLKKSKLPTDATPWSEDDKAAYTTVGDVAKRIRDAAQK